MKMQFSFDPYAMNALNARVKKSALPITGLVAGIIAGIVPQLSSQLNTASAFTKAHLVSESQINTQVQTDKSARDDIESQAQFPAFEHNAPQPVRIATSSSKASNPFNSLVGRPRVRNKERKRDNRVTSYVLSDTNQSFLFYDNGNEALIQFQCGAGDQRFECLVDQNATISEIITLQSTRAPRGDIIYKDELGNTVLRIASYGGATIWWPGTTEAQAASRSFSDIKEINFSIANERTALRRANRATALLSAITGEPIEFITPIDSRSLPNARGAESAIIETSVEQEPFANTQSVEDVFVETPKLRQSTALADTILVASKGMAAVAADPTGARVMGNRLNSVRFNLASAPSLKLDNGVFEIGYSPALGLKGRPSSAQIQRFLEENL